MTEEAGRQQFLDRVHRSLQECMMYEDPAAQDAARKTVPLQELDEKAITELAEEGNLQATRDEIQHARLKQLLLWFKGSFRWVNHPQCESCGSESVPLGQAEPNSEDRKWLAATVELYRCNGCSREVRFPRYNDPRKLLETRRGRCGEWANCFTLYCRALGYQARLVIAFTDHVWTECYLPHLARWVHTDPCEGVIDQPLLYEEGWEKKLNYVIGVAHNGVHDVTKRYTRKWPEVLTRRTMISEEAEQDVLMMLNMQIRADLSDQECDELVIADTLEDDEISQSYQEGTSADRSLPGRQSGSEEWRAARGETGNIQNSSSSQT